MAALRFCGDWLVCSCDRRLLAVRCCGDSGHFELDCASLEKKKAEGDSEGSCPEGGSEILAVAVSASGTLLALSDDSKRLVLLQRGTTWSVRSVRCLPRRCTSLVFSRSEDTVLAADKSGDVYSLSVQEPLQEPQLQLGHLSMLLDVAVSQDDRFIVTCDRDEKIRVSLARSPYNIQSFCLGHRQFVSALLTLCGRPHTLLSGSGDGTVRLWNLESGRCLQTVQLQEHLTSTETQRLTVSRLSASSDGRHVAVLCERLMQIQMLSVEESEDRCWLRPQSCLTLVHCPLDLTFDPADRLWVLLDRAERPLQVYSLTAGSWEQVEPEQSPELSRVSPDLQTFWTTVDESDRRRSRLEQLYVETFDNVSEYMKKKEQRLREQSSKRNRDQSQDQSQNKKTRPDPHSDTNGS